MASGEEMDSAFYVVYSHFSKQAALNGSRTTSSQGVLWKCQAEDKNKRLLV